MGGVIALLAVAATAFNACDDDLVKDAPIAKAINITKVVHGSDESTGEKKGIGEDMTFGIHQANLDTFQIIFDGPAFFADIDRDKVTSTNGLEITDVTAGGAGSKTLTVVVKIPNIRKDYELDIPAGIVTNGQLLACDQGVKIELKALAKSAVAEAPVMATSAEAISLYKFMRDNYEKKTISGMMANVNWNTAYADSVGDKYGRTPLINGFDYIHLLNEKEGWIDYTNITPVKEWHAKGGIVAMTWHWMVPQIKQPESADKYKETYDNLKTGDNEESKLSYSISSEFKASRIFKDGEVDETAWEGYVYERGMETVTERLKLLKDAGIPVLWRPYHEASGGWFWWGEDAATFKKLWIDMFNRFKEAGLDNLIWVWTSDVNDFGKWYPGDEYVDVIGVDLYGGTPLATEDNPNPTEVIDIPALDFCLLTTKANKMLTLSECGYSSSSKSRIAKMSAQTKCGISWSWFMPWYDDSKSKVEEHHADDGWWKDAMMQDNILWLGDYKK